MTNYCTNNFCSFFQIHTITTSSSDLKYAGIYCYFYYFSISLHWIHTAYIKDIMKIFQKSSISIELLPDEVLLSIFAHLDTLSIIKCEQVSKRFRKISKDEGILATLLQPGQPTTPGVRTSICLCKVCVLATQNMVTTDLL